MGAKLCTEYRTAASMARLVVRVALLDCEDASKWSDHLDIWRDAFAGADDDIAVLEWTRYRGCLGELPTTSALDSFDAIVVPGSHHTAVAPADGQRRPPWMQDAMDLIRSVVTRGHPQLFCACFGHQLLAAALGGRVEHGEKFVFKAEEIGLNAQPWRDWVVRVGSATGQHIMPTRHYRFTVTRACSFTFTTSCYFVAAWFVQRYGEQPRDASARESRRCSHGAPARSRRPR